MADSAVKIPFIEAAAPSTPAANRVVIYCKSDGLMYSKDDAGVETLMSAGGGGIPATILDAKGDIIAASAADTAAKLTVGANDLVLTAASGETTGLKWAHPVLTSAQADCTASVTLTADTIADVTGCSLTLSVAGTYLLQAQAIFTATTAARDYTLAAITDSSNAKVSEVRGGVTSAMPESLFLAAVVTIGSSTTYKLRGQSARTNNTVTRYGSGTDIGTRLIAVRVA